MINVKQNFETTTTDPTPHRNILVKCLLKNGDITRHSFKAGNIGDIERFLGKLAGKILGIQFASREAIIQEHEENNHDKTNTA